VSQLLVGRFFFIHESQAARDTGAAERTFEFLHATFGEFLAARQIVGALVDLAEERRYRSRRPGSALDAGYLYAATSFVTMTRRVPLFEFCRGLLAREAPDVRRRCRELVLELLPDAGHLHPTWSLAGYEPRRRPFAARHAAFSANLVCFAVLLSDGPVDTVDLVGEPVVVRWKSLALLWQSQLEAADRQGLWQTFRVAWQYDARPSVLRIRVEDGADVSVYESIPWPTEDRPQGAHLGIFTASPDVAMPAESLVGRSLRRSAFVQTAFEVREHLYALMPYWQTFGDVVQLGSGVAFQSDIGVLMQVLLTRPGDQDEDARADVLSAAVEVAQRPRYMHLVLRQIVEEIGEFRDDVALRTLVDLNLDDLGHHPRLVARLAATIAVRGPMRSDLLDEVVRILKSTRERHADFDKEIDLAFAGVGLAVPEWARSPTGDSAVDRGAAGAGG
jgi:hypothetical protein